MLRRFCEGHRRLPRVCRDNDFSFFPVHVSTGGIRKTPLLFVVYNAIIINYYNCLLYDSFHLATSPLEESKPFVLFIWIARFVSAFTPRVFSFEVSVCRCFFEGLGGCRRIEAIFSPVKAKGLLSLQRWHCSPLHVCLCNLAWTKSKWRLAAKLEGPIPGHHSTLVALICYEHPSAHLKEPKV